MSCVPTSLSISKSVITSSFSPVLASRLCAPYKPAVCIMFTVLNLILDYFSLKLAVAIYRGVPTKCPFPCVLYIPYVPIWSSNVVRHHFWPIKA